MRGRLVDQRAGHAPGPHQVGAGVQDTGLPRPYEQVVAKAALIAQLASPLAGSTTGADPIVDGGAIKTV